MKETVEPKQLVFKDKKEALEAFKEFLRDKVNKIQSFIIYFFCLYVLVYLYSVWLFVLSQLCVCVCVYEREKLIFFIYM